MLRLRSLAVLAGLILPAAQAAAHGVCGPRIFVSTLTIDDPAVADEASLPTFAWTRDGSDGGKGPTLNYDFDFEFAKRITPDFGLSLGYGFSVANQLSGKSGKGSTDFGWHNLELNAKYAKCVDATHELMLAFGITREFGSTGTLRMDAARYGTTTPTLYFGKGFGDIGVDALRPLALTGTFAYAISDVSLKRLPNGAGNGGDFNQGAEHQWQGGLSLQYSLPYLQSQVKDMGLPEWIGRLTPLVEFSWSSPATAPSATPTQMLLAPGVVYNGDWYQLGIEALIPLNRATGRNVGLIAQFHVYLDDLLPNSLGKPIFSAPLFGK